MLSDLIYRIRVLLRRGQFERELEEELRFHLEREAEKNSQSGLPADEAERTAGSRFGRIEAVRQECRDSWGTRRVEEFVQDCRYATRIIRKNPFFCALVVVVLGLTIGATTAIFSVVSATILKPLPFRDPARLLAVWDTYQPQFSKIGISPLELQAWQTQRDLFEDTAWYRFVSQDGSLTTAGSAPFAVHLDFISTNLFPMAGMTASLGRGFARVEDPGSALLSDNLWRTRFGAAPGVIGRAVRFNDQQLTIVGVMPPGAQFPAWADLWLPKGPLLADQLTNPVRHALGFISRLRTGVNEEQVRARLRAISKRLADQHPTTSTGWGIRVSGLQEDLTGDVRPTLLLLMGAASLLWLIACVNIANLLLSRASARAKEIAVRAAVGAGSLRIVRQLLTEDLILALVGGLLGLALAKIGLMLVIPAQAKVEPGVLLFLLGISVTTGLLFGLAPAIYAFRADTQAVIKTAGVTGGSTTRSALVVLELALTLALVIGAGILARSFLRLMRVNPGFDPEGVLTVRILAPPSRPPAHLFHGIEEKLLSAPGVETIAVSNAVALIADRAITSRFNVPGSRLINPDALPAAQIRVASPGYFAAMKIPVKAGRVFAERDLNQPVVIINETMARRFWPDRDAVGQRFITGPWGPQPAWSTIVGVVSDVREYGLDSEPGFEVYYPSLGGQYLIIRSHRNLAGLAAGIEKIVHSIDPDLAVTDIRSMNQIVRESARTRFWTMRLLAAFASLAFLLALVGIYGVTSWSVAQRKREVGIRVALGARRREILGLVLGYGFRLALTGLAMGLVASLALRRILASFVYGVSTADPVIYISACVGMLAVVLAACYLPARKAAGADPLLALRHD